MLTLADFEPCAIVCALVLLVVPFATLWLFTEKAISWAWLNGGTPSTATITVTTTNIVTAAPKGWWTSDSHFQLERRAVFSKTWICVGHRGRFVKPGDYVSQDFAGFRIFLILGKDNVVRAFHNLCRHRAFPVTRKASGSTMVLGCQYHGWSYNSLGQLIKAPQFDQIPGFEKSENGLYAIHTKTDSRGFLHINFSGSQEAGNSAVESAKVGRWPIRIDKSAQLVYSWEYKGRFNWNVIAHDRWKKNDAMHQAAFSGVTMGGLSQALAACGIAPIGQLQFFPFMTVHTKAGSPFWYHIMYSPDSARQTTMRCEVYRNHKTGSDGFEGPAKYHMEKHLQFLVEAYESAYTQLTNPMENDPQEGWNNYGHAHIASLVQAHREAEYIEGREIYPAAIQRRRSVAFMQAESICQAMTCATNKLDW